MNNTMNNPISFDSVHAITDQSSFINFLKSELNWPIPETIENFDPVSVPYDVCEDLGYKEDNLPDIEISRLLAMDINQPWGVFLFKFSGSRLKITDIRKIVRKLSSKREELQKNMPIWNVENILIIATADWEGYQFIHLRGKNASKAEIHSFGWQGPGDGFLRTLCEYNLPNLKFPEIGNDLFGELDITKEIKNLWIQQWKAAFDVKAVTDAFYKSLKEVFGLARSGISGVESVHARHIAELLINRLLFLKFVEKKGWLDDNKNYLLTHYNKFKEENNLDNFYSDFLCPLFFNALNNSNPDSEFKNIPYLNGGLFAKSSDWNDDNVIISGQAISALFDNLINRYNFTIRETDPLDVEVAFDQDLLGYAYEELIADRHGQGAYYTHPTEVNLMCRESLRAFLEEKTEIPKTKIGKFVYGDDEVNLSDGQAFDIYNALYDIKICDPAIGSGSYPVAMLKHLFKCFKTISENLTDEQLKDRFKTEEYLNIHDNYKIKLHIIERSIYGCDIDEFAVEIARLRFWVELMVEMNEPEPLPNFDFKFITGDALVSYWGKTPNDKIIDLDSRISETSFFGKEYLNALAIAKHKFYQAKTPAEKENAKNMIAEIRTNVLRNILLPYDENGESKDEKAKKHIHWQLDFAEVFANSTEENNGFDIMIANPPYLRQELIESAFQEFDLGINKKNLIETYQKLTGFKKLNAKSDLYVYFFIRGIQLLKQNGGIFCYICSNSWLDVGYGAQLQEFILNKCQVRAIIDNSAKRSFASADVNTTINIFVTKKSQDLPITDDGLRITDSCRFITFRKPFEDVATEQNLRKVLSADEIISNDDYRVYPISREKLRDEGTEKSVNIKTSKTVAKYGGDKWGGKYLRAPDIFFKIIEKGKDKLVRLGDIADVRRGITTGCNEFFYLTKEKAEEWGIEKYVKPVIKSSRESRKIKINSKTLNQYIFICKEPMGKLPKEIRDYICWGEKQNFHQRPSTSSRNLWYSLGNRNIPEIVIPCSFNDAFKVFVNSNVLVDKRMYECYSTDTKLSYLLNSTLTWFFAEVCSRTGLGQGLLDLTVYEVEDWMITFPNYFNNIDFSQFQNFTNRIIEGYSSELYKEDRRELDKIIFDELGLTDSEREEVYQAVIELVSNRLNKAKSV